MGIETTKALQGRRRRSAAQADRLIARAEGRILSDPARRTQTSETARLARRKLRALTKFRDAISALELEIGRLLLRLVGQGMSRNDAFELAGLQRHLGRRYLDCAMRAQSARSTEVSTDSPSIGVFSSARTHRGLDNDRRPGHTTPGRKS
jgi:hypothetical protein